MNFVVMFILSIYLVACPIMILLIFVTKIDGFMIILIAISIIIKAKELIIDLICAIKEII
jgi:hypothetical protein